MYWFVLAACSALLSAVAAVLQKKALFRTGALEFSFQVSVLVLALSSFIPFTAGFSEVPLSTVVIIALKSVLGAGAFLLVMIALERNPISDALPLLGLTPAAAALLSLAATGESLSAWEWGGVALMTAGTYLVEKRPAGGMWQPFRDVFASRNRLAIAGALVLFACSSVVDRVLVGSYHTPPLVVLFYQHIIACVLFGLMLVLRRAPLRRLLEGGGREQLALVAAVAALSLAYRFFQLEATKLVPVALVLAVKRTSILFASFYGGRLFAEERLPLKLAGGALIVAAGFVLLRNA